MLMVPSTEEGPRLHQYADEIPDGATVFMFSPSIYDVNVPLEKRFDLISYTEYADTRDRYRGKVSLLYAGIEECTNAAVNLLERRAASADVEPLSRPIEPRVIDLLDRGKEVTVQ